MQSGGEPVGNRKRRRDTQRSRVYAAERQIPDLPDSEAFLQELAGTLNRDFDWDVKLHIKNRASGGWSRLIDMQIVLGRWGSKLSLLHEFAHQLAEWTDVGVMHGPLWAGIYVELVRRYIGPRRANQLADAFDRNGVRWDPDPMPAFYARRVRASQAVAMEPKP